MSDGELVAAYLKGCKEAWDALCSRYTKELRKFFVRKTGNREDAKDLAQDTLIEAMVNLRKLHNLESFQSWLYKIARGHLSKWIRNKNRRGTYEVPDEVSADAVAESGDPYLAPTHRQPDDLIVAQEQLDIVRAVVNRFPPSERKVLLLKLTDPDMKMAEIAETLGISTGAVKARLHRARKRLREQLEEEYPDDFTHLFE